MQPIISGKDYLSLPRSPETWLVDPLIPAGGSALLYGDPKVGKSYAALQLAMSIQTGSEWLGFPVRTNGKVVYIQLDTPRSLWALRLDLLTKAGYPVETVLFADRETLDSYPFNILNPVHANTLKMALSTINPVAVIIDTLRESCSGADENDATAMQSVVAALTDAVSPAALILVAHPKKPSGEQPPELVHAARGSGYLTGRMDAILRFTKKTIYYTGRAIEEGSIRLERTEEGLWAPSMVDIDRHIYNVQNDPTLTSTVARAKALSQLINRSEESCRSLLRRAGHQGRVVKEVTTPHMEPKSNKTNEL